MSHRHFIERHAIDTSVLGRVRSRAEEDHEVCLQRGREGKLGMLAHFAYGRAVREIVAGGDAGAIYENLMLAYEARLAVFQKAGVGTGHFAEVALGPGPLVRMAGTGITSETDSTRWEETFWLARLLRHHEGLDFLCAIPVDVLRRSVTSSDEHGYRLVAALQAIHRTENDASALIQKAIETADPATMTPDLAAGGDLEGALVFSRAISHPYYLTLARVLADDEPGFQRALRVALERHRDHYSDDERRNRTAGFISLPLCGVCAIAHDRGMRAGLESDYLPTYLIEGAFPYPPAQG